MRNMGEFKSILASVVTVAIVTILGIMLSDRGDHDLLRADVDRNKADISEMKLTDDRINDKLDRIQGMFIQVYRDKLFDKDGHRIPSIGPANGN